MHFIISVVIIVDNEKQELDYVDHNDSTESVYYDNKDTYNSNYIVNFIKFIN